MFVEGLTANWQRAREAYFPGGPTTRDEKFVWNWTRLARTEDVKSVLESVTDFTSNTALEWQRYHPEWVRAALKDAVAVAVNELRQAKRDKRAERRRKRLTGRRYVNGRRVYTPLRGRPPKKGPPSVKVAHL